jgi:group I intron endonuclease
MHYLYYIENKVNGKIYIGQTLDFSKRKWEHLKRNDRHNCHRLNNAINKHGKENFNMDIFHICDSQDEANEMEIYWIDRMRNTLGKDFVYNIKDGGKNGNHSEETKQKMRNVFRKDEKLNDKDIKDIKLLFSNGMRVCDIALKYHVHQCHISRIINGKRRI